MGTVFKFEAVFENILDDSNDEGSELGVNHDDSPASLSFECLYSKLETIQEFGFDGSNG